MMQTKEIIQKRLNRLRIEADLCSFEVAPLGSEMSDARKMKKMVLDTRITEMEWVLDEQNLDGVEEWEKMEGWYALRDRGGENSL